MSKESEILNEKLKSMWNESAVACFKVLSRHFRGVTK